MSTWTVRRAEGGGSGDRVYAHAPDGSEVGWLCLRTGHVTLAQEFYRSAFGSAVASWRLDNLVQVSLPAGDLTLGHAGAVPQFHGVALAGSAPQVQRARVRRPRKAGVRRVGAELGKLLDGWHVLRTDEIGLSGTGIDHLVVGPGGAFAVTARSAPGARVCIDGERYLLGERALPYLRTCAAEAEQAGELLSAACGFPVQAHGMLVLTGELQLTVLAPPTDAYVTVQHNVAVDLTRMPLMLAPTTVDSIVAAARRPSTWARSPHV